MNRHTFLKKATGSIALLGVHSLAFSNTLNQEGLAPLDTKIVKEFVVAGHRNLDKVKEMIQEYPNLIYARYDWGNSDFEEAIEGAGHLGNKEIAEYLIGQGARVNLFVLTMLGKSNLVIPTLNEYPELVFAKGPHGFTLLHHAKVGGSEELQEYLLSKGLTKTHIKIK
ncbi:MAG: ankyrin repeat domain-containing protein [Bacteroidota bacterium]